MRRSILYLLLFSSVSWAQSLSFGVKAGAPLTSAQRDVTFNDIGATTRTFSDSKEYVIGGMVELRLPFGLGVEADALYHPANVATQRQIGSGSTAQTSETFSTLEFPILGKFRPLPLPFLKPYVELGPTFRRPANRLHYISGRGTTIGAGVEFKALLLRISPELRYTRWGSDEAPSAGVTQREQPPSSRNQVMVLVGISF